MDDKFVTIAQHEEFEKRMEADHKRFARRLDIVEKKCEENNRLLITVEKMAVSMENMQKEQSIQGEKLDKQGERLEELENRDGEAWKNMKDKLIGAFLGAIGTAAAGAFIYALVQSL